MKITIPLRVCYRSVLIVLVSMLLIYNADAQATCAAATTLTPGATCTATGGNLQNATNATPTGSCGGATATTTYSRWYKFTATSTGPTITVSSLGSSISGVTYLELLSGTCASFTSLACQNAGTTATPVPLTATGLTVGTVYYIRVYVTTNPNGATASKYAFNICIQNPVNDDCSNATSLTEAGTCSNTAGTLAYASPSTGITVNCGNSSSSDVWYKFVATQNYPVITLSSIGSSLLAATPVIQLFSGTCGSLTSLGCLTGTTTTNPLAFNTSVNSGGAGLTVGGTYYIRIYTNTNTGTPTGNNWTFNICITNPATTAATLDFGKSYVNVSKGTNGGTTGPGDTLEIRATFVVKANTAYQCSFADNIPANTTYMPGTLKILTNEGKTYQTFTDALDADGGTYAAGAVTINFGAGANATTGGNLANTSKPSFYGGTCIILASYRVQVNTSATYGTKVPVGFGTFKYYPSSTLTPLTTKTFPADTIMLYNNYGICSNTVGTNAITSEYGGTFGYGKPKNRTTPSSKISSGYTDTVFTTNSPNDYYYGISNNTSTTGTGYTTSNAWAIPEATPLHRLFGVEDIIGDHTGATNPLLGNPPADTVNSSLGGYLVFVNASYRTDTAYLDTITNLCPNTYYQYSAWFRNMCSRCGCDSNGNGASTAGYIPTATGDSSGVYPNLTFNVNGYDYYTTGNMLYTGQWIQKGFTYQTGASQTSLIINIRNNAPGGGGNDWAIDDIGVATCSPSVSLTPNKPDTICQGSDDTVRFKVSSYFNNYTQYMLQQSTDHGVTWTTTGTDTTGAAASGTGVPVYNSATGQYEYTLTRYYQLSLTDSLTQYRITVATSVANLSNSNCSAASTTEKYVYGANCAFTLPVNIVLFKGAVKEGFANLQWVSASESPGITYTIERSDDGTTFLPIGTVPGDALNGSGASYSFVDPKAVGTSSYYRINMNINNYHKYTNTILLSNTDIEFDLKALVNPFTDAISFDLTVPADNSATFSLVDMYGRMVKQDRQTVNKGLNSIRMYNLSNLSNGTYTLQVQYTDKIISKRVIKLAK